MKSVTYLSSAEKFVFLCSSIKDCRLSCSKSLFKEDFKSNSINIPFMFREAQVGQDVKDLLESHSPR